MYWFNNKRGLWFKLSLNFNTTHIKADTLFKNKSLQNIPSYTYLIQWYKTLLIFNTFSLVPSQHCEEPCRVFMGTFLNIKKDFTGFDTRE